MKDHAVNMMSSGSSPVATPKKVVKRQPRQHFGRFHCLIRPPRALKPSSFEIRKNYKVPDQCLPPKPPPLKSTRKDPYTYDSPPVFVEIQTLSAGEVFGLDQLNEPGHEDYHPASHKVSLVSKGAEVIMLNKKCYVSFLDENTMFHLRRVIPNYPSPEAVKHKLRLQLAWVMWSNKKYDEFQQDLVNKNIRMANLYFQEPQLLHPMEIIKDLECPIV